MTEKYRQIKSKKFFNENVDEGKTPLTKDYVDTEPDEDFDLDEL